MREASAGEVRSDRGSASPIATSSRLATVADSSHFARPSLSSFESTRVSLQCSTDVQLLEQGEATVEWSEESADGESSPLDSSGRTATEERRTAQLLTVPRSLNGEQRRRRKETRNTKMRLLCADFIAPLCAAFHSLHSARSASIMSAPAAAALVGEYKVQVYLYDLSQGMAKAMSLGFLGKQIDGIWHTGVVVYGREYFYGGGIQAAMAGQTQAGRPMQVIDIGYTRIDPDTFHQFLEGVSHRFTAATYNLLEVRTRWRRGPLAVTVHPLTFYLLSLVLYVSWSAAQL